MATCFLLIIALLNFSRQQYSLAASRFGYVNHVITIRELIDSTYEDLFCNLQDMFSSTLSVPFDWTS